MKPFLCVQLYPRDLFKTEATYGCGQERLLCSFEAASLHFFCPTAPSPPPCPPAKTHKSFSCCLELTGSCAFSAVCNLSASELPSPLSTAQIIVKPVGSVALGFLCYLN